MENQFPGNSPKKKKSCSISTSSTTVPLADDSSSDEKIDVSDSVEHELLCWMESTENPAEVYDIADDINDPDFKSTFDVYLFKKFQR